MMFGLVPSLQIATDHVTDDLQDGGTRSSAGPRSTRTREALVTLQLAVALVLLVGSILLLRSFSALVHVDTGIDTHNLLTFNMFLSGPRAAVPGAAGRLLRADARAHSQPSRRGRGRSSGDFSHRRGRLFCARTRLMVASGRPPGASRQQDFKS